MDPDQFLVDATAAGVDPMTALASMPADRPEPPRPSGRLGIGCIALMVAIVVVVLMTVLSALR